VNRVSGKKIKSVLAGRTGMRPHTADLSVLPADDMVIYRKIAKRAECR